VIAVSRDAGRANALRQRGADAVVAPGADMAAHVRELTGGAGADLVFEHVGGATFAQSVHALAPQGRLVLGGVTAGTEAALDLKAVFTKRLEVLGCRGSGRRDLDTVLALVAAARVTPHVERVLPLAHAATAHRTLEAGGLFGKIVLTV
jgi:NADPH:quinone reductase-like Zn-dependent oxidoreductase